MSLWQELVLVSIYIDKELCIKNTDVFVSGCTWMFSNLIAGSVDIRLTTGWSVRGSNPGGARFSNHPAHPASCRMVTGSFPEVKWGRGVLLKPHPLVVQRSWKSRAITLPKFWPTKWPVTGTIYLYLIAYWRVILCQIFSDWLSATLLLPNSSCPHSNYVSLVHSAPMRSAYWLKQKAANHTPILASACLWFVLALPPYCTASIESRRSGMDGIQTDGRTDGRTDRHKEMCSAQATRLLRILAPCLVAIFQAKCLIPGKRAVRGGNV